MTPELAFNRPVGWLIGICRPQRECTTDSVVDHLAKISKRFESMVSVRFAVLKSRSRGSWGRVAVYAAFELAPQVDAVYTWSTLPEVEVLLKDINSVAEAVDVKWYEMSCEDHKGGLSHLELTKGDVVHLRRLSTEPERQDILSYSCLAILKAYFEKTEGLLSCAFYNSLDRRSIMGLGVWESEEAARTWKSRREGSPARPYWKALGAKLKYRLYEVAYVSSSL